MDKLDQMIAEALAEEDRALVDSGEPGIFLQLARQYQGPNAWVNWITSVAIFAYVALMVWTGWHFFTATDPLVALKWGLVAAVSIMAIGMLKLYLLGAMQTDRVIRELKRVELMLAAREK